MLKRFTRIFALLAVALTVGAANAQHRAIQTSDLIGSYTYGGGYSGSTITIEPEGKFHINSSDCTQQYFESGTYSFKDRVLSLTTTKRTVKTNGDSDDRARNLLDPEVYEAEYREKLPANPRTNEFLPVFWGERLYLIDKEDVNEFPNAINLGVEPRKSLGSDAYLGSFFLRRGDEKKPVVGSPDIQRGLLSLLIDTPIEARVINIEFEGDQRIAVIDRGCDAGVKQGMRFVFVDKETFWDGPSLWSGLVVLSVTPQMSRLKVFENVDIGDKISSKFVDRRFKESER